MSATGEPAQRPGKVLALQVQLADVEADHGVDAGATGTSLVEERRRQARVERKTWRLFAQRPHLSRRAVGEQQVDELGRECQQRLLGRQAVRASLRPGKGGEPGSTRPLLLLQRLDERPMQPAVTRESAERRANRTDRFAVLAVLQQPLDRPELGGVRLGLVVRPGRGTLSRREYWIASVRCSTATHDTETGPLDHERRSRL